MENSFGKFLSNLRKQKNLTQKDLAKRLYVTESAVSKWEIDKAHPDITLLPKLAEILGVSEHELITASVDKSNEQTKKDAKRWTALVTTWELAFLIAYGITLLTCFIVDLAVSGGLTWFWIVFTALLLSASFTNMPKDIKKYKVLVISSINLGALILLIATCCIYVRGNWFWVTITPIIFTYVLVFLPIFIAIYDFPKFFKTHNALISAVIDYLMLFLLFVVCNSYTSGNWVFSFALPLTSIIFALILVCLIVIRYLKINAKLKTSIILFLTALFACVINPIIQELLKSAFGKNDVSSFDANFLIWQGDYVGNNVFALIVITLTILGIIFFAFGNKPKKNIGKK